MLIEAVPRDETVLTAEGDRVPLPPTPKGDTFSSVPLLSPLSPLSLSTDSLKPKSSSSLPSDRFANFFSLPPFAWGAARFLVELLLLTLPSPGRMCTGLPWSAVTGAFPPALPTLTSDLLSLLPGLILSLANDDEVAVSGGENLAWRFFDDKTTSMALFSDTASLSALFSASSLSVSGVRGFSSARCVRVDLGAGPWTTFPESNLRPGGLSCSSRLLRILFRVAAAAWRDGRELEESWVRESLCSGGGSDAL
mmetsp:Transcript_55013/g.164759  ORF Transcript_55013/g.164759 Transcript_55013/m.164759 type:complete len:252 (+) Transcript_55013:1206-1961(+)